MTLGSESGVFITNHGCSREDDHKSVNLVPYFFGISTRFIGRLKVGKVGKENQEWLGMWDFVMILIRHYKQMATVWNSK